MRDNTEQRFPRTSRNLQEPGICEVSGSAFARACETTALSQRGFLGLVGPTHPPGPEKAKRPHHAQPCHFDCRARQHSHIERKLLCRSSVQKRHPQETCATVCRVGPRGRRDQRVNLTEFRNHRVRSARLLGRSQIRWRARNPPPKAGPHSVGKPAGSKTILKTTYAAARDGTRHQGSQWPKQKPLCGRGNGGWIRFHRLQLRFKCAEKLELQDLAHALLISAEK